MQLGDYLDDDEEDGEHDEPGGAGRSDDDEDELDSEEEEKDRTSFVFNLEPEGGKAVRCLHRQSIRKAWNWSMNFKLRYVA